MKSVSFKIVFSLSLLILNISCSNEQTPSSDKLAGEYKGTFLRTSPNAKFMPAEVTVILTDSTFEGSSSIEKYPAICNGSYQVSNDEVTFNNECFFTADFDWTLILAGKFKFYFEAEELVITRSYEGNITDTYRLKKSVN